MKIIPIAIYVLTIINGCISLAGTTSSVPHILIPDEAFGEETFLRFKKLQISMTEEEVLDIMGRQPDKKKTGLWEYNGDFAKSEPYPVRDVFRILFQDGKVNKMEKTISDCIYVVPIDN
jgi:hypothetical protein